MQTSARSVSKPWQGLCAGRLLMRNLTQRQLSPGGVEAEEGDEAVGRSRVVAVDAVGGGEELQAAGRQRQRQIQRDRHQTRSQVLTALIAVRVPLIPLSPSLARCKLKLGGHKGETTNPRKAAVSAGRSCLAVPVLLFLRPLCA